WCCRAAATSSLRPAARSQRSSDARSWRTGQAICWRTDTASTGLADGRFRLILERSHWRSRSRCEAMRTLLLAVLLLSASCAVLAQPASEGQEPPDLSGLNLAAVVGLEVT